MTTLKIKRLSKDAIIPTYAHSTDSGMDLYYCGEDVYLAPGETKVLEIGISIELPPNTEAQIRSRSGLAAKYNVSVLNSPGTVDEGYTGEIKVILHNGDISDPDHFLVMKGDRIAQMVIAPVIRPMIEEVVTLSQSDRGANGFGSTGN